MLQRLYESFIPPALTRNSQVLQLHQQTIILAAHNGAIAAKLKQLTPELISLFRARGCEVTGIQIRVQVTVLPPAPPTRTRRLGGSARDALERLDHDLPASPLKSAVARLLKR